MMKEFISIWATVLFLMVEFMAVMVLGRGLIVWIAERFGTWGVFGLTLFLLSFTGAFLMWVANLQEN